MARAPRLDRANSYVRDVVRSFAHDTPCPPPPVGSEWHERAREAGVLSVVLDTVRRAGHPAPAQHPADRFAATMTHLRTMADLGVVARLLDARAVRWAVIKGPVLSQVVYRRSTVRTYSDLDVLVHPDDLAGTIEALTDDGAVLLDRNWELISAKQPGEISLLMPGGTALDLHWHVINNRRTREDLRVSPVALLARRVAVRIDDVDVPTLDPLDTVLYTAQHAGLSGGHSLKWSLDLQQAVAWADPDPAALRARADEHGLTLLARCMLARAGSQLDPRLVELSRALGRPSAWSLLCGAIDRLFPPGSHLQGRYSGRLVVRSTRSTTARSVLRLVDSTRRFRDRHSPEDSSRDALRLLRADRGTEADRDDWYAHARASA